MGSWTQDIFPWVLTEHKKGRVEKKDSQEPLAKAK